MPCSQTKVKVYYSLKGSKSTRLATFQLPGPQYDHDTATTSSSSFSAVTIPLKNCLWAICSSSPDMVCHEHDLTVYSTNYHESQSSSPHSEQDNNLIWEGHGLMSWVMEDQHSDQVYVSGKLNHQHIDVRLELQPTLRWRKSEFHNALQSQDAEGLKHDTFISVQHSTSTYACSCGINSSRFIQQQDDTKGKRLTPPLTPSSTTSPTLPSISVATTSVASSTPTHLPPPTGFTSSAPFSPPSSLFRPEPILPPTDTYFQQSTYLEERKSRYHLGSLSPPSPLSSSSFSSSSASSRITHHDQLPYPLSEPSGRSAFNSTIIYQEDPSSLSSSNKRQSPLKTTASGSSFAPSHSTPIIHTPCNKKRRKNPPVIMPADGNRSSTGLLRDYQQQQQLRKQRVSTNVRTYYEVDRNDRGLYILPVEIDSWTVIDLGTVVYDRPAYHNQRYIYPVNYTVRKWYRSMIDPKSDTQYTCRILDNGREPRFEVTADDCPVTYSGFTPSTVWTIVVRQAFKVRGLSYNHNPVGPDFFGLRKNTIAKMIQDLPNVDKCMQYIWQTFEPARFNKPGRNRRRLDTMVSGSILGGVNYGLTSGRLNTAASHQQQIQQRRLPSTTGVTGTIDANYSSADESSRPERSYTSSPPQSSKPLQLYHHHTNFSNHSPRSTSPSYSHTYHSTSPSSAPIKTV
ncbi:hypothetical protein [Absidia glauca]|uniref:Ams2/SPT21 N-terminal domain-containing protein n=1 Tax=Absidia glauca TaxID=4829 RepID=A0A168QKZ3_ABSGL|nr:hypothetical protein [Absidia glauca]